MEKHVCRLYKIVDGVTDDLWNCDCRVMCMKHFCLVTEM